MTTPPHPLISPSNRLPASFRDPSGFVFTRDGQLYRQVNRVYQPHYDRLVSSGLLAHLVKNQMMVDSPEVSVEPPLPDLAYRVLAPERVPVLSYPYEWSFSQLKDAALLTLHIQQAALTYGMTLKDASAYNVQFWRGRPVLIDTLSFETYQEGKPWDAYRQYCQHFLAPLALMALRDPSLNRLLQVAIDGVPLDLASRLLPWRTHLNFGLLSHIHLHAGAQKRYAAQGAAVARTSPSVSRASHQALIANLEATTRALTWKPAGSEWADYYDSTNYSRPAFDAKRAAVQGFLERIHPQRVLDLGANTGVFSRLASAMGVPVVSADIDPAAVERNYLEVKQSGEANLLPLVLDLTNPSPAIGWDNQERSAFFQRVQPDTVMALALIHHLAISNNLPLGDLAQFFSHVGRWLIIEFVPKEDSQVQRLLASRKDIFPDYHKDGFEAAFAPFFSIIDRQSLADSRRTLYLMENRAPV